MIAPTKAIAVTGAASGIGFGVAKYLALNGATIFLADVNQTAVEEAAASLQKLGTVVYAHCVDVTDSKAVNEWLKSIEDHVGGLDGAVNCAGILSRAAGPKALAQTSDEEFDDVLRINLGGMFRCIRAQSLIMRRGGCIVNVSSAAGLGSSPMFSPYGASKHGVISLTKSAARESSAQGIRVNCVAPGCIDTPMLTKASGKTIEQLSAEISMHTPLGRMGTVDEVAKAVSFLLGDDASYITGAVLAIDGGMTA